MSTRNDHSAMGNELDRIRKWEIVGEFAILGTMGAFVGVPIIAWGLYRGELHTVIAGVLLWALGPAIGLVIAASGRVR